MTENSGKKRVVWMVLCLGLVIWGLTDVRQRAHFDPVLAAENREVIAKHRTDLTVFTEAGAAFFDGRDPYEVTNPRGWMYLYPPLFAILMSPLHELPPQWQGVVWYFISLAMAWGCYWETFRLLSIARITEITSTDKSAEKFRWIQVAVFATILFPTLDCLQRGQVGILILYLLLLGLRLVMEAVSWKKSMAGGLVLSLPIVIKIIPILPVFYLLFLLLSQRVQKIKTSAFPSQFFGAGAGVLAGLILFFFVVPSVFIGWQSNGANLKTWSQLIGNQAVDASVEGHFSSPRRPKNQSLQNALYHTGNQIAFWISGRSEPNPWQYNETAGRLMASPVTTQVILSIRVVLALLLVPIGWRISVRGDPLDRLAAFGLACTAMLIVSPVARGHYFMLELPAVLFVSLWLWQHLGFQKALLCAGIPAALSIMHYTFITFPQISGFLGVGTLFLGTLGIGTALWYLALIYKLIVFSFAKSSINATSQSSSQGSPLI